MSITKIINKLVDGWQFMQIKKDMKVLDYQKEVFGDGSSVYVETYLDKHKKDRGLLLIDVPFEVVSQVINGLGYSEADKSHFISGKVFDKKDSEDFDAISVRSVNHPVEYLGHSQFVFRNPRQNWKEILAADYLRKRMGFDANKAVSTHGFTEVDVNLGSLIKIYEGIVNYYQENASPAIENG